MSDYEVGFGKPPKDAQFKPGQSGNPGGKPLAARQALNATFLKALSKNFDEGGEDAIERCRLEDPTGYVRVMAALLPKEIEVKTSLDEISDDQLSAAITSVRAILAAESTSKDIGVGSEQAEELQPA